jgi:Ca-activated chloride channel family protein
MFRWAHPEHLYALAVIPVLLMFFLFARDGRSKRLARFGERKLVDRLIPFASANKPWLRMFLFLIALVSLALAWANPQFGSRLVEVKREGVDVIIALDVSNSMKAEDIKPNRLERSKQLISRLIDRLENDRIGIVVFAGQAYVQLPITTDYAAAKLFLNSIDTDIIPTQGTAIGAALDLCQESFVGNDNKHKVIVLITDGENHEDDPVAAAKKAAEAGVIVHAIGMGSPDGVPVPIYRNGNPVDYLRDRDGNTVLTKLDELTLQQIAAEARGEYVRATNSDDGLNTVVNAIGKMEKKQFGTKQYSDYEDRFQILLAVAIALLVLESLLSDRRSERLHKLDLFGERKKQEELR